MNDVDLQSKIVALAAQVPPGEMTTYGAIADALGDLRAAPAVKRVLDRCDKGNRVVNASRAAGEDIFTDFSGSAPLRRLRTEQLFLRGQVTASDDFGEVTTVAGVDVAYRGDQAYGAYVELNMAGTIVASETVHMTVRFPYIPTYLSYRELPVLNSLMEEKTPSLVMVDGNGILHPYGLGLASHFGVLHDLPVIGVAKSLLCGEVRGRYVYLQGRKVGVCYGDRNPIYVSPGHRVSLDTAAAVVERWRRYRIPEPIRRADIAAGEAKKDAWENDGGNN